MEFYNQMNLPFDFLAVGNEINFLDLARCIIWRQHHSQKDITT